MDDFYVICEIVASVYDCSDSETGIHKTHLGLGIVAVPLAKLDETTSIKILMASPRNFMIFAPNEKLESKLKTNFKPNTANYTVDCLVKV
jgi:hypothetical protein